MPEFGGLNHVVAPRRPQILHHGLGAQLFSHLHSYRVGNAQCLGHVTDAQRPLGHHPSHEEILNQALGYAQVLQIVRHPELTCNVFAPGHGPGIGSIA